MLAKHLIGRHFSQQIEHAGDDGMEGDAVSGGEAGVSQGQVLQLAEEVGHVHDARVGELQHQEVQQLVEGPQVLLPQGEHPGVLLQVGVEGATGLLQEAIGHLAQREPAGVQAVPRAEQQINDVISRVADVMIS